VATEEFDELLKRMPEIAEAVNKFTSEEIQIGAFKALVSTFIGEDPTSNADEDLDNFNQNEPLPPEEENPTAARATKGRKVAPKRTTARKQSFSLIKDLDLINGASPSFPDFAAQKNPRSNPEKCLVAVYWLTRTAEISPVTADHVYTTFKFSSWEVPTDLINTLQQAGTKGWLDSKKRDDLKVVVAGENQIEHKMPPKDK
jgi:hypothetical protein